MGWFAGETQFSAPTGPYSSRQQLAERSQQGTISLAQLRASDLPLEHPQLVTQQQDLDLLLPFQSHAQDEQLEQTPQGTHRLPESRVVRSSDNAAAGRILSGRRLGPVGR
jgi:hypothetical protein